MGCGTPGLFDRRPRPVCSPKPPPNAQPRVASPKCASLHCRRCGTCACPSASWRRCWATRTLCAACCSARTQKRWWRLAGGCLAGGQRRWAAAGWVGGRAAAVGRQGGDGASGVLTASKQRQASARCCVALPSTSPFPPNHHFRAAPARRCGCGTALPPPPCTLVAPLPPTLASLLKKRLAPPPPPPPPPPPLAPWQLRHDGAAVGLCRAGGRARAAVGPPLRWGWGVVLCCCGTQKHVLLVCGALALLGFACAGLEEVCGRQAGRQAMPIRPKPALCSVPQQQQLPSRLPAPSRLSAPSFPSSPVTSGIAQSIKHRRSLPLPLPHLSVLGRRAEFAVGLDWSPLVEGLLASCGWDEMTYCWHMNADPRAT